MIRYGFNETYFDETFFDETSHYEAQLWE